MKVGIIGGGVAGLAAAVQLNRQGHSIKLFDKMSAIGGHVKSVEVPFIPEESEAPKTNNLSPAIIELGVFMLDPINIHPKMATVATSLGIKIEEKPITFAYENINESLCWSTNVQEQGILRSANFFMQIINNSETFMKGIGNIPFLLELQKLVSQMSNFGGPEFENKTMQNLIDEGYISELAFEDFVYPQMHFWWGITHKFAKECAVATIFESMAFVCDSPQYAFPKGWQGFLEKFTEPVKDKIFLNTTVESVETADNKVTVKTNEGTETFDHLIFATDPGQVSKMLGNKESEQKRILNAFTTVETEIFLHRDTSWMPQKVKWATTNTIRDERGEVATFWAGELDERKPAIFISWGDGLKSAPDKEKIVLREKFRRTLPTVDSIKAGKEIASIQGSENLWYCGAHVHSLEDAIPSVWHENAMQSGLKVAEKMVKKFGKVTV